MAPPAFVQGGVFGMFLFLLSYDKSGNTDLLSVAQGKRDMGVVAIPANKVPDNSKRKKSPDKNPSRHTKR